MTKPILSIQNISKKFGSMYAIKNINLSIFAGRVHTLLGENGAGKSTLMKILAGVYTPNSGSIFLHDKKVVFKQPLDARKHKIAIIFQELSLSSNLSVAKNIYANHEPHNFCIINDLKLNTQAAQLLNDLAIPIDPYVLVAQLSMAQRQLVEIAKALSVPAEVIIMDEPTSSLSDNETNILFNLIDKLKSQGKAIIYISHRMEEIMKVSDDISVMRDGEYIGTYQKENITIQQLIAYMVGREMNDIYPKRATPFLSHQQQSKLSVKNLSHKKLINNVSFSVHSGEIVGFFGLVGAGRSDVMKALFGLLPYQGEIYINQQLANIKTPKKAIDLGIAFVTENRKDEGLVLLHSVDLNINHIAFQYTSSASGLINFYKQRQLTDFYIKKMNIKTTGFEQAVSDLSGGNQQKVVISKWLAKTPEILILDEPTRGVDVGAKLEIYKIIRELSEQGTAIILVSSELPEAIAMSDRLLVMKNKTIVAEFDTLNLPPSEVMRKATGAN